MAPESAGRGYGAQISRIGRAAGPAEFRPAAAPIGGSHTRGTVLVELGLGLR